MYEQGNQESAQNPRGGRTGTQSRNRGNAPSSGGGADRQSYNGDRERNQAATEHSMRIAELAIRGTTTLLDIQLGALRSLWQMHARAAAVFGLPDSSDLLRVTDDGFQRVWASGTEQLLASTRQANEAFGEMQRQFGQILEEGTTQLSEQMRSGLEDLSQRTQSNLQELQQVARQSAQEGRQMLREGEQFARSAQAGEERSGERSGGHGSRAGEQGAQSASGASAGDDDNSPAFVTARERAEGSPSGPGREGQGSRQEAEKNGGRSGKRH